MEEKTMESDCANTKEKAHGGFTKLSDHTVAELNIVKYAEARAKEIDAMDSAAQKGIKSKKATQAVPFYMRRRAASHNIKRLPRRLRDKALKEMKDAPPKKTKRPSRKHRRRPSNLLQDYNRRKKAFMWLETHIWHAKRFHMQKQWGYNVANFPNDKSLRACYRASVKHCLMWDLSYLCCLEINGPESDIIHGLKKMTSPDAGCGIGSMAAVGGSVEGTTTLYHTDQCPRGAIGPATFLWKPIGPNSEIKSERTVWLWVHPVTFSEVLKELLHVFTATQVTPTKSPSMSSKTPNKKETPTNGQISSPKAAKVMKDDRLNSKYPDIDVATYKGLCVEIVSLKDTLCRFRLIGPESLSILTDVLLAADVSAESNETCNEKKQVHCSNLWWEELFCSNQKAREIHEQQTSAWAQIARLPSGLYLPPHTVLGLTVQDPRLRLPEKRIKVNYSDNRKTINSPQQSEEKERPFQWPNVSYSPLWERCIRANVKDTKLSEQEINARRAENLIPGQPLQLDREESRIPVLLIQRPGLLQDSPPLQEHWSLGLDGQGSGWDLILPGGWAMAFWIALVYRGARVGGVRELVNTDFELGQVHFPDSHPDTLAGKAVAEALRTELEAKHNRRPPAKRPNYHKLGVAAPFHCPWKDVCGLESSGVDLKSNITIENTAVGINESFFVLRSKSQLNSLHALFNSSTTHLAPAVNNTLDSSLKENQSCLVAVQVLMVSRGTCASFAPIHFPSEADLDQLARDPHYEGPVENIHREFKSGLVASNVKSVLKSEELEHTKAVCPDREVCGYVCDGGFSLHMGKGAGLGYITLHSLHIFINSQFNRKPLVLVRCPTSRQYRFAHVSVLPQSRLVQL